MGHSRLASLYDLELAAAISGTFDGPLGCRCQCCVKQFTDRPNVIGYPKRHSWRAAKALMRARKIVKRDVQADGGAMRL